MRYWLLIFFICTFAYSTEYLNETPEKIRTAKTGLLHWVRSEAYRDSHPLFHKEKILAKTRFQNPEVVKCFPSSLYKGDTANSALMVLLYAPGWNTAQKTPLLLVHGAGDDAFRAWAHPKSLTTPKTIAKKDHGFMQKLAQMGYPVFAINFSHNHGCNYRQAEQIHNAIRIIKKKTNRSKVHLIAHSKGNCASSIYLADGITPKYDNFLSPFAQDVDIYVQIGAPNKGIDIAFRFYMANIHTLANDISAPVCFQQAIVYGVWKNLYKQDIYLQNPGKTQGNYFPGQNQLLYNLVDDQLPFSILSYTPIDLNLTMKACYYGGTTQFVASYGIEHAIKEGEYTIARINKKGLAPSVRIINVYGTNSTMKKIDLGFIKIPIGVSDYPSDGVLYKKSAMYTTGITSRGAKLIGQRGFDKNHLDIARTNEVLHWIVSLL